MDKKKQSQIMMDHQVNGLSYRTLGKKYGVPISTLHDMINKKQRKYIKQEQVPAAVDETLPDDVKILKEELRKAKLKIELQDLMIDIASKELGVDIRKKSGTRRS
jgi:transposase